MSSSELFRRRLWDTLGTALLAVVLALVVWVNATYQNDMPREGPFPDPIHIEVLNAPKGLILTNQADEYVSVRIKAFASSWSSLRASSFRATADWSGLSEGVRPVPVKVTCSDPTVTILSTQPESVYVQLERLAKQDATVRVELKDMDDMPLGYAVGSPQVEPESVTLEGPASAVESVAAVIAELSLAGQRTAVDRMVEVHPLDRDGKLVSSVRLTPEGVRVRLEIEKKLNYREVAVRARTKGQPARGYFVSSVGVEPDTVTVVGPPAIIAAMPGLVSVKGEVDVTRATRMLAERMELDLPEGVSLLTEREGQQSTVLVTVGIDAVTGGTTVELPLQARKLGAGLMVRLSVPTVDVILRGPAVLLDDLETDLLDAYVDIGGLGEGKHQVRTVVDILVAQDSELRLLVVASISPGYVEADIRRIPTPTPTATATSTPTPTPTATITPTLTMTPTVGVTATLTVTPTLGATPTLTLTATLGPLLEATVPPAGPTPTSTPTPTAELAAMVMTPGAGQETIAWLVARQAAGEPLALEVRIVERALPIQPPQAGVPAPRGEGAQAPRSEGAQARFPAKAWPA